MKFIVFFLFIGFFLNSSYAGELQASDKTQEDNSGDICCGHQKNFSDLVESAMDLMGPELPSTQVTDQAATKSSTDNS